jgi:hypothetical protein
VSAPARDLVARLLDFVIRLLPGARREWGRAMQAELASLERLSERLRFALGCTRVVLLQSARARSGGTALAAVALVALSELIGPAIPVTLMLLLLAWLGRRPGHFGPVRPDRATRTARAAGWAVVGAFVLVEARHMGLAGLFHPNADGLPATLPPIVLAAAFLAVTARDTRLGAVALAAGATAGLAAGLAGFLVTPFARIGAPLADGLPFHGSWLILVVFAAPAAAALLAGTRTLQTDQGIMAAACAGTFAALVFGLLGLGAIALFPHSVPDVSSVMPPGTSAAARQAENAIAASDPYWGFLAFGALLATLLWVLARPPRKPDVKFVLLLALAAPPIALALVAGAGVIAFATTSVVLAAAVTTRPAQPA